MHRDVSISVSVFSQITVHEASTTSQYVHVYVRERLCFYTLSRACATDHIKKSNFLFYKIMDTIVVEGEE